MLVVLSIEFKLLLLIEIKFLFFSGFHKEYWNISRDKGKKTHVNEGLKILTFGSYNRKTFLSSAGKLVSTLNSI